MLKIIPKGECLLCIVFLLPISSIHFKIVKQFDFFLFQEAFTDATLACEGKFFPIHKFVLSTCSEYFSAIFEWTPCVNPVVVINNISCNALESLLDFMYKGEANVLESNIQEVMKAAECLHIRGLTVKNFFTSPIKSRSRSPVEEPVRKKKRSVTKSKKSYSPGTFVRPNIDGPSYQQSQAPSPTPSVSSYCSRPTPTPPPIQQSHSPLPSPLHASSTPIPSPVPVLQSGTIVNQPLPSTGTNIQMQKVPVILNSKQIAPSTFPASIAQSSDLKSVCMPLNEQHSKLSNTARDINEEKPQITSFSQENLSFQTKTLRPHDGQIITMNASPSTSSFTTSTLDIDTKMETIGEEIHLDGPVKDLEIATEGGTVSIPEILEGLVDMQTLYESKSNTGAENISTQVS